MTNFFIVNPIMLYLSGNIVKKPIAQVATLTVLALIVHAIVLKFIFPGYYSPLYPHHSDFYIAPALANSSGSFFKYKYLGYSRPLGLMFLKIIGHLGLHGAILFTILNVAINCGLTAVLFRHLLGVSFGWQFILLFCIYCLLLFCQPYFYTFYTQDVFSHLSYFFLLTGSILFYQCRNRYKIVGYAGLLIFSICAFLCKETYALTALFIAFAWLIYYWRNSFRQAIMPLLIISLTLTFVLVFNIIIKSVFIDFKNTSTTDPYYIKSTIPSVYSEMLHYAVEGLNVMSWLMIVIVFSLSILFTKHGQEKIGYLLGGCIIGAFLSWIPNSLIPNHHHGGYSFNGAYLLYLPILSFPLILKQGKFYFLPAYGLLTFCLLCPLLNSKKYAEQWWILEQERNQRNLLHSLDSLMSDIRPSRNEQSILITGLTMPFYPFHHPMSLKNYPNSKYATYDVVNYSMTASGERDDLVKFIQHSDVKIESYSTIWMFSANGSVLRSIKMSPAVIDSIIKHNFQDLVINPDSIKNSKLSLILK